MRNVSLLVAFFGTLVAGGCAPAMPPQDLVTARSAYDHASKGSAQALDPTDVHTAKEQLDVAEAAFSNDGDTQNTKDQAYLAVRKSELAEVHARTMQAKSAQDGVVNAMHADETAAVAKTSAALGQSKAQLASQSLALNDEKTARADAEKRAAQANADLAKLASVKQDARGTVITLSGSVLFASAKSDLLPSAQLKLNDVATALIKEDPLSKMVVEGHTDSQGGASYNQDLSQHRADSVRNYLVERGVAGDRISAQGFGSTRSIADNTSADGRANNRRVEIVVAPSAPAP
ncbi:MAG TPA: OmpA family protein [Polyangiaceae bacterium]|jgi:outer membrane protein OmpA-like peptidoglycan-associated protein|nr:OmpA family protein [Polyangiaceae bacterium]